MSIIVTDAGFGTDSWGGEFLKLDSLPANLSVGSHALDLQPDAEVAALAPHLEALALVRIAFPSFADGRGFTLARHLRSMGYQGRLRAAGHVIADQYDMARRSGFDEVEISEALAARQPEEQWRARADWQALDYRARLAG